MCSVAFSNRALNQIHFSAMRASPKAFAASIAASIVARCARFQRLACSSSILPIFSRVSQSKIQREIVLEMRGQKWIVLFLFFECRYALVHGSANQTANPIHGRFDMSCVCVNADTHRKHLRIDELMPR